MAKCMKRLLAKQQARVRFHQVSAWQEFQLWSPVLKHSCSDPSYDLGQYPFYHLIRPINRESTTMEQGQMTLIMAQEQQLSLEKRNQNLGTGFFWAGTPSRTSTSSPPSGGRPWSRRGPRWDPPGCPPDLWGWKLNEIGFVIGISSTYVWSWTTLAILSDWNFDRVN